MRIPKIFGACGLTGCAIVLLLSACSATSAQPVQALAPTAVVATVGPTSITLAEVDERALEQSTSNFGGMKLGLALYEARRAAIDELVGSALMDQEAKARGLDRAALTEQEINGKATPVTDAEVAAWYQANQARVQGATLDQVRAPIKALLIQERAQNVRRDFLERLTAKTTVRVLLEPPRQTVKMAASSPARGPANAPIEMIDFSDFQCPFCGRVTPTLKQVLDTYGDRIHFVYREYPLPNHPNARPASEAGLCANEQGQFWPYHDRLFANQQRLSITDLKQTAAELGLDKEKFNACVDSRKYKAAVDADMEAGNDAGVSGTPAFFINGRMISGAQPFDAFKRMIDEELERKKR